MKIALAMSGGVDSSVAAALLKFEGHEVAGVTMKIWAGDEQAAAGKRHGCFGPGDREEIADAQSVASKLGIPHHVIDLTKEYRREVLDYFCEGYKAGLTPNPCVRCNQQIKFGMLIEKTRGAGIVFDKFATGHYARVEHDKSEDRFLLKKARDLKKDQSYFLSALTQGQLALAIFPLGEYTKDEVRKMAGDFKLDVAEKPESQDFAESGYLSLFTAEARTGPVMDTSGNVIGQHRGIQFYTIGQRKGLRIASEKPLYVVAIEAEQNAVIVGEQREVYCSEFYVSGLNWIAVKQLMGPVVLRVRIRYAHKEAVAIVSPLEDNRVKVRFEEPQMAIAPGQTAVLYDGDVMVGGGTIEKMVRL